jgi:hypothetical protein
VRSVRREETSVHIWIVLAAFALAAVTPFISAPNRNDVAQMMDELNELEQASKDADEDEGSA